MISTPSTAGRSRLGRSTREPFRLSARLAFAAVAAVIGTALYASATPSPLYGLYQAKWHFSTPVLSLIYATYAVGVLTSLLLVGGISDQTGRRPVLAWSLLALLVSMGVFATADSVTWLFVARALQGLATGGALGAAGAALIDLHPSGDVRHVALVNGAASLGGLGGGALVSSVLVQLLPDPRIVPFLVVAAVIGLLLVAVGGLPKPIAERRRPRLRPQRPAVPDVARGPFALAALGVVTSWSIAGLYLALGPGLAGQLLHTQDKIAGGLAAAALLAPGAAAQIAGRGLSNRTLTAAGAALVALGMALTAIAVAVGDAAFFLVSSGIAGIGFGLAFMGALRHLSAAIPADRRGEVMSAFYVVGYLSLALPTVAAGLTASALGLSETFEIFSAAAVVLAAAVTIGGLRIERPAPCPPAPAMNRA